MAWLLIGVFLSLGYVYVEKSYERVHIELKHQRPSGDYRKFLAFSFYAVLRPYGVYKFDYAGKKRKQR